MASCMINRLISQHHQLFQQISKASSSLSYPTHRCFCSTPQFRSKSQEIGKRTSNLRNHILVSNNNHLVPTRCFGSKFEPAYLDTTGPEVPFYDALNIQLRGYDFSVLEKFAKHVHKTAERIGLTVEEAWGTPSKNLKVTKLKPESNIIDSEYTLKVYERNVQIVDVPATVLPVFINVIEASIPAGTTLRIHPHLPEHAELRYVPDLQLVELRTQLGVMRGETREKK